MILREPEWPPVVYLPWRVCICMIHVVVYTLLTLSQLIFSGASGIISAGYENWERVCWLHPAHHRCTPAYWWCGPRPCHFLYLIEVPYGEGQSSPWRIVRLSFAVCVAGDVQVHSVLNIVLISKMKHVYLKLTDMGQSEDIAEWFYNTYAGLGPAQWLNNLSDWQDMDSGRMSVRLKSFLRFLHVWVCGRTLPWRIVLCSNLDSDAWLEWASFPTYL